ncbi:hypothetical protein C8R44DRAFT_403773 [Mycena epipterygia]|nr:hypothetical protein C8R44DRAFT_403773 [Mycena epipterygia]
MPSPPIEVFLTTIASQPALRQRQEYILRILQVKKIPFSSFDLASDEKAKRLWKRKAPLDKQQLPGILVGGKFPGTFAEFEDAVECNDLDVFLRLKESWNVDIDEDNPPLPAAPIGVPGAMMPLQMTPEHLRTKILAQKSSPLTGKAAIPVNKRTDAFDVSTELSGFGLQGVQVTEDELRDLVAELGLDGDEAGDLVKGLSSAAPETKEPERVQTPTKAPTKASVPGVSGLSTTKKPKPVAAPVKAPATEVPSLSEKKEPEPVPAPAAAPAPEVPSPSETKEPEPVAETPVPEVTPTDDSPKVTEEPTAKDEAKSEPELAKVEASATTAPVSTEDEASKD